MEGNFWTARKRIPRRQECAASSTGTRPIRISSTTITRPGNTFRPRPLYCCAACWKTIPTRSINLKVNSKMELSEIVNLSITQTFTRSINTSLTTFIMVFVLFILGVSSIREFALPLMVGIVCGTYSSVCITGSLWYVMTIDLPDYAYFVVLNHFFRHCISPLLSLIDQLPIMREESRR